MNLGLVGLGRMGNAIADRVVQAGHTVFGFDFNEQAKIRAQEVGVQVVDSLDDLVSKARIIWLMVPAGDPVDKTIDALLPKLQKGDTIIDGGNSKFSNSIARAQRLAQKGVFFLDCGTSGGLLGRKIGFCLMIGGDKSAYDKVTPIFKAVAADNGFGYMGPSGSGHYVKMVHNGIEYGLLQAYAEGFHLLKEGYYKDLNLENVANVWRHGAVIRSWLLDLAHDVYKVDREFDDVIGTIQEGGTGKWTVEEAKKQNIAVPIIEGSLRVRRRSRETGGNYATKLIALLRNKFGGHAVEKKRK